MTIPTLSTLPTAPARTDAPATFVTRADAFLAALVTFQSEMNTSIGAMNTDIAQVNSDAAAAATSASEAAASATAAGNAAGASMWVSGQSYAEGDAAISGIDYQTYRAETATSGTTDPSADANWTKISGVLPSETGNAGKFLTTDGSTASWVSVPTGAVDFTASGSITAGDPVALNADNTVSTVFESGTAGSIGTEVTFQSTNASYSDMSFNSDSGAYVSVSGTSSSLKVTPMTLSGTTITAGSNTLISTSYTPQEMAAAYNPTYGKHACLFTAQNVGDTIFVAVYSENGSSLTSNGFNNLGTTGNQSQIIYHPDSGNFVVIYRDYGAGSTVRKVRTMTPSASTTNVTFGTAVDISTETPSSNGYKALAYEEDTGKCVALLYEASASGMKTKVISVSGTGVSVANGAVLPTLAAEPSSNSWFGITLNYDTTNNRFVCTWMTAGGKLVCCYGTLSGTTVTWGTVTRIGTDTFDDRLGAAWDSDLGYIIAATGDVSTTANYINTIDVTGSTPTLYKKQTGHYAGEFSKRVFYDTANSANFVQYGHQRAQASVTDTYVSNVDDYLGLANNTAADTETVTVAIENTLNESQTGLTIGQGYWLNANGTLSSTDTGYSFVGTAVAADKINLVELPDQTNQSGKFLTTDGNITSWGNPTDGSWNLISTTTASAASTVDIEDFSTDYKMFKVVFRFTNSSNINQFRLQLNIGGTYRTSTYKYFNIIYDRNNSTSYTTTSGGNSQYIYPFEALTVNAGQVMAGEVFFPDPNDLVRHVVDYKFTTMENSNESVTHIGNGLYPSLSGSTLSGARFSNNTGTMTGEFLLYGLIT